MHSSLGLLKNLPKEAPPVLITDLDKNEKGDSARLKFHIILLNTVKGNLNANFEFHQTVHVYLKMTKLLNIDILSIRLILISDSFQLIDSLAALSAGPLWAAITDLPPMKRAAFRNMTLSSLFFWQRKARHSIKVQSIFKKILRKAALYSRLPFSLELKSFHFWSPLTSFSKQNYWMRGSTTAIMAVLCALCQVFMWEVPMFTSILNSSKWGPGPIIWKWYMKRSRVKFNTMRNVVKKVSRCEKSPGKRKNLRPATESSIDSPNRYNASVVLSCSWWACVIFLRALTFKTKFDWQSRGRSGINMCIQSKLATTSLFG